MSPFVRPVEQEVMPRWAADLLFVSSSSLAGGSPVRVTVRMPGIEDVLIDSVSWERALDWKPRSGCATIASWLTQAA